MTDPSTAPPAPRSPTAPARWLLYPRETALLAVGVVAAIALHWALFGHANYYEFAHFAEIAKNMANGEGFVSYSTQPASLAFFHEHGLRGPPWPVGERFIGYPALLSVLFRVLGVHDGVVVGANMVVFVLLVSVLFQAGVRLFDRGTALLACLIFILNPIFTFNYVLFGFLDPLYGLLVWAVSLCLLRLKESERPLRLAATIGVLYGVAYLVRYSALVLTPLYLVLVVAFAPGRRAAAAAAFGAPVAVAVLGLMAYNSATFGVSGTYLTSSWVMAEFVVTGAEPWRQYASHSSWAILFSHFDAVLAKFSDNVTGNLLRDITRLHNLQLLIPFAVHGFFVAKEPRQRRILAIIGLPLVAQFLLFALSHPELGTPLRWTDRYYFWGSFLVLLFGAWGLRALVGGLKQGRAWLALFLVLLVASFSGWWRPAAGFDADAFYARDYLRGLPRGSIVATNLWHNSVSLYYGNPTIELPHDPQVVVDVRRDWPVDTVLLSADPISATTLSPAWAAVVRGAAQAEPGAAALAPVGFVVDAVFADDAGNVRGVALRARP